MSEGSALDIKEATKTIELSSATSLYLIIDNTDTGTKLLKIIKTIPPLLILK